MYSEWLQDVYVNTDTYMAPVHVSVYTYVLYIRNI